MHAGLIGLAVLAALAGAPEAPVFEEDAAVFKAGYAEVDITPQASVPLWGYGVMHRPENNSTGVHDPLFAKALVLQAGETRAALVGLDLGRAPFEPMVARIEHAVLERAGIEHVFLVGSHTHHAPALELVPVEGLNDPALDNALAYYAELEEELVGVIMAAANGLKPARIGWASAESNVNRNRHTEEEPIPRDPELFVLRADDLEGNPIAIAVNFAAHPTNHPHASNQISADFPGVMMAAVTEATGAPCMFLQGAAGDLQCDIDDSRWGEVDLMREPGEHLAREVIALNATLNTAVPEHPDLRGVKNTFSFQMRLDLSSGPVSEGLRARYGEPLYHSYHLKYPAGMMHPKLTTLLVNGELAIAGGSGEFFSDLSVDFKRRVEGAKGVFVGYCNGHDMYFPTRRAMAQGGYGADPSTAWVMEGGPERMIDRALWNFQKLIAEAPGAPAP